MFELNNYLLLFITIVTAWLWSFLKGIYTKSKSSDALSVWNFVFFQNTFCLIGVFLIYITSSSIGNFSLYSVLLGMSMGFSTILAQNSELKAYNNGSFSYTIVIVALSAIIPSLSGLFFGEKISFVQYIGVILMIVCIILSTSKNNDTNKQQSNFKWLIYSLFAMVFSGFLGVIQKVHQSSELHKEEMAAMLMSAFFVSTVFSAIKFISEYKKRDNKNKNYKIIPKDVIIPALSGLSYAFPHTINLFLVGKFPTVIFFPIVNIVPIILAMFSSVAFLKERLSPKSWLGIFIGIMSILLISGII